jgi:hypothetical protein
MDFGGWLYLLIVLGVLILATALIYDTATRRKRRKDLKMQGLEDETIRERQQSSSPSSTPPDGFPSRPLRV